MVDESGRVTRDDTAGNGDLLVMSIKLVFQVQVQRTKIVSKLRSQSWGSMTTSRI